MNYKLLDVIIDNLNQLDIEKARAARWRAVAKLLRKALPLHGITDLERKAIAEYNALLEEEAK